MDETKFKNHAEKEFWEKILLIELEQSGRWMEEAITRADVAIAARRLRMTGLAKPGVKAA